MKYADSLLAHTHTHTRTIILFVSVSRVEFAYMYSHHLIPISTVSCDNTLNIYIGISEFFFCANRSVMYCK